MIDLPNLRLTDAQWQTISRKVIASIVAGGNAAPSQLEQSNVIDMFTRKRVFVKLSN